jgi:hypothetical protein
MVRKFEGLGGLQRNRRNGGDDKVMTIAAGSTSGKSPDFDSGYRWFESNPGKFFSMISPYPLRRKELGKIKHGSA